MKLTVYDKGNSHPAMTYKGKRVVTVNRDGTIYLSKVLTLELGQGMRGQRRGKAEGLVSVPHRRRTGIHDME